MRCTLVVSLSLLVAACAVSEPDVETTQHEITTLPSFCLPAFTYYVDASAAAGGNGSSAAPFRRINEAVSASKALDQCTTDIYIYSGTYTENLWLDRQTTLRGAGCG